jgi:hypothetical protein
VPRRARQRQHIAWLRTGTQDGSAAVERSKDGDGNGDFPPPAKVAAGNRAAAGAQFPDSCGESVCQVLNPADRGIRRQREAYHHGCCAGPHGVDVAEVLCSCLPADVVAGGAVAVGPGKAEVLVLDLGVDADDGSPVGYGKHRGVIPGAEQRGLGMRAAHGKPGKDPGQKFGFGQSGHGRLPLPAAGLQGQGVQGQGVLGRRAGAARAGADGFTVAQGLFRHGTTLQRTPDIGCLPAVQLPLSS